MKKIINELSFYIFQMRQNLHNQKALRGSFWLQIIGQTLGSAALFIIWIMFSRAIGTVNGWGAVQTFGMLSVNMLAFGLCYIFFGSISQLQSKIISGSFDSLLTKPKSLYLRIVNCEFRTVAFSWLLQGIAGLLIFFTLTGFSLKLLLLIFIMMPPAVLVQLGFLMVTDCLNFWLPQAALHRPINEMLMISANQPTSLLQGPLRYFYLMAIPSLLIAGLPVEVITYHKYKLILVAYIVSISWVMLSVWFLNKSIRRYESGNVIG